MRRSSSALVLGTVILAAGAARRMGRPKLLLSWGDTSVLGHLLRQWQGLAAAQIAVVCASRDPAIAAELDRLQFPPANRILNPTPEAGMFSSIRCAAVWQGWKPELTHWAIALGDQPHLQSTTLRHLSAFAAAHPQQICQPHHAGRSGHPVVLPKSVFTQLPGAAEETLRQFLGRFASRLARCVVDDPGLHVDLDTPADYAQACRRFGGGGGTGQAD
jgi:molybdenum cofactor cytidylyltransferase